MKFPYASVDSITHDLNGFYRISHEAYHSGPGISSSRLKKALVSWAAYVHKGEYDSAALAFGRAFHMAILEPDLFDNRYAIYTGAVRRGKSWDDFQERAKGFEILTTEESWTIDGMIQAVRSHPEFARLPKFDAEIMAITTCPETHFKIKCKADLFGHAIVDFKTTSSGLQPGEFLNDIIKWRYHVSAAFYQDIIQLLTGERLPFVVVPVTKKAPYECEFYNLSDEILEEGRKLYKAALRRIKKWSSIDSDKIYAADKRMRTLYPSQRLMYSTQELLDFVEAP